MSFAEAEDRDKKKEVRVLGNRSLPSISTFGLTTENMGRSSRTKAGPSENNRSCRGREIDDDGHRTTMAASKFCASQLLHLRPLNAAALYTSLTIHGIGAVTCVHLSEILGGQIMMPKEIITETYGRSRELELKMALKAQKGRKEVTENRTKMC